MGCKASKPPPNPYDLDLAADIPCDGCGSMNSLEPRKLMIPCFKCDRPCRHTHESTVGIINPFEAKLLADKSRSEMLKVTSTPIAF
jgi:hypothetical protein